MRRLLFGMALLLAGCGEGSGLPTISQLRPVDGGVVTSWFGSRPVHPIKGAVPNGHHDGYDIAVPTGRPIKAAQGGVVKLAGWSGGYGRTVVIDHGKGWTTLYGHAAKLLVKPGDRVAAGARIALVGSTGLSTGPHVHYELRHLGVAVEPGPFISPPKPVTPAVKVAALKRSR